MNNKKIGSFISSLRKEKHMTQKELADKLFISEQAVSKWERGLSIPDIGLIEKLASYLDVSVSEILKGERINNITFKSKNKNLLIIISFILIIAIILYLLGTIDYIRTTNGKKPIFIYKTINVTNVDINKEGIEYFGIGYKITLCNKTKNNYIFEFGHKQKEMCYTTLSCSETFSSKNDKHSYDFSFYDDKLFLINAAYLIPTKMIEDEEVFIEDAMKMNDVVGVNVSIKKINNTTYELKQTCNIAKMLMAGSKNVCLIDYFNDYEIYDLTRSQIDNYYHKDSCN